MIELQKVEKYRVPQVPGAESKEGEGHGVFNLPFPTTHPIHNSTTGSKYEWLFTCHVQHVEGWDRLDVTIFHRNKSSGAVARVRRSPLWDEMQYIKWAFWGDDEWVVQYHKGRHAGSNGQAEDPYMGTLWHPPHVRLALPPGYERFNTT